MPPRRACDVCYKRKIQCSIKTQGDPCDWCSSQGLTCTFDRVIQKDPKKRTTSDVVQDLSHRVEELEEALQSALATNTSPAGISPWSERSGPEASNQAPRPFTSTPSPAATAGQQPVVRNLPNRNLPAARATHFTPAETQSQPTSRLSRCQLGTNWYFKGVGILSARGRQWISEGAGQRTFLEDFDVFGGDPVGGTLTVSAATALPQHSRPLPPETILRYLFGVFSASKTSIVFPILNRDLFEGTIARAYNVEPSDVAHQASAEACLWAMLALVVRTEEARQFDSIPEAEDCVQEVTRLLRLINGSVNLDSLEATLLLWAYQKMKGRCREASSTLTSACRMVCDLGGHVSLLSGPAMLPQHIPIFDEQSRLHIRGLFWLCYCFDKDASLRTDSPPILTSDHCDLGGPDGDYSDNSQTAWYNRSRDINLAKVKETACRLLCSPRAFRYTEGELLAHVRQLDDELEEWRLSIEPRRRPKLSIPSSSVSSLFSAPSNMSAEDRTHMINLQLDYLFTMINIHTLVRKCGDLQRNLPDDLHRAVHSSADLSIEAGRSIFRLLEIVVDFWEEDSVWVLSHYAPMAAMPLFVNILIHPLGHPADSDLQILSSISDITRKVPTEKLSVDEIERIQEIGVFVMELIRLSHSAAWKAKKGEREHDLDIIHR